MKYPTIFNLIASEFKKENIPFVLIGGFAVNYYKVIRQTADVDIIISKDSLTKVEGILQNNGYKKHLTHNVFSKFKPNKSYLMDIDTMQVDENTMQSIVEEAVNIPIAGEEILVPSLNHLIALKLHSIKHNQKIREYKDLPDIINLVRVNKINVRTKNFENLCLKYGTKEMFDKILNA